ncbi:ATP-dependent DNA helicase PcrA [Mycobacterium lentiflavum]|uniref:DNA 3'-5' helicase n=1 Tax=Mycobacterium lentiflavum TaxID=141349 RepID=A0A0E4CRI9_MYCLN|nr:ATP-dependent helicase [Mycobacterium lentiflavum]CQD24755.1 ATP-dependent DNA helicase PcrA [Mycobacterium lentiflavum]
MSLVAPDSWRPSGIDDLEPAAWQALRDDRSTCVTAGPGAGKSEFLAQRASYLLLTGLCPAPRRILAISFKRDAASNLERRVGLRAPEHAHRFTSMTFDAFTKHIVDRFGTLLPGRWKMAGDYKIQFSSDRQVEDVLTEASANAPAGLKTAIDAIPRGTFMTSILGTYALPIKPVSPPKAVDYAVEEWWRRSYLELPTPVVEFVMLNRLAELIIRTSPQLQRAINLTYPYVFVDEFQDTTFAQYTFLRSLFRRTATVTAVGDRKQRIMGWAGALTDAFSEFQRDFAAAPYALRWNFRSTEALVDLQHRFARLLDSNATTAAAQAISDIDGEAATMWSFGTARLEARTIAAYIAADTESTGRSPADYALIARQRVADFEPEFRDALSEYDIVVRNDDASVGKMKLQDLLKDNLAQLLLGVLKLAATSRGEEGSPQAWAGVSSSIANLRSGDDQSVFGSVRTDDELAARLRIVRQWMRDHACNQDAVDAVVDLVTEMISVITDGRIYNLADTADDFQVRQDAFRMRLKTACADAGSWRAAVTAYEARDAVPLLTIHRSKGLEYHTVFFLGLDDDQWWAHQRDLEASIATFFVGLSRAAQRVVFTQCDTRGGRRNIADLYEILDQAGVPVTRFG